MESAFHQPRLRASDDPLVRDVLHEARELIATPERFAVGTLGGRTVDGREVSSADHAATRLSLLAALSRAVQRLIPDTMFVRRPEVLYSVMELVEQHLPQRDILMFCLDSASTHEQALKALDSALESQEALESVVP